MKKHFMEVKTKYEWIYYRCVCIIINGCNCNIFNYIYSVIY